MRKSAFSLLMIVSLVSIGQAAEIEDLQESACINSECCEPGYFFANASFLYWNAQRGGLEFTTRLQADILPTPPKNVSATANSVHPDFPWKPGVRASIGYRSCDCGSSVSLTGTYFWSKTKAETAETLVFKNTEQNYLVPAWNPSLMGWAAKSADAEWKLQFGMLDFLVGGIFTPWGSTVLKPNFGLRGVWIDQYYAVNYRDTLYLIIFTPSSPTAPLVQNFFHSKYKAVGFKAGIDFEAPLFCNIDLIGGFGTSLVYGKSHLKQKVKGVNPDLIPPNGPSSGVVFAAVQDTLKDTIDRLSPNLESELGLSYGAECSCIDWALSASYHFSIWFDQNDFKSSVFTSSPVNGIVNGQAVVFGNFFIFTRETANLFLQGLEVKLEIQF